MLVRKQSAFRVLDAVFAQGTLPSDVVLISGAPGLGKSDFFLAGEKPWNTLSDGSQALRMAGGVAKRVRRRG